MPKRRRPKPTGHQAGTQLQPEKGTPAQRAAEEMGEHEEQVELERSTMAARREHAEGAGNFPTPEPRPEHFIEPERDRTAKDVPKERDPRSAPKGNLSEGQRERNPELEMRDEFEPKRPAPPSGFELAEGAPDIEEPGETRRR